MSLLTRPKEISSRALDISEKPGYLSAPHSSLQARRQGDPDVQGVLFKDRQ